MDRLRLTGLVSETLGGSKKLKELLKNQPVILAVSGGIDSIVLFDIFCHWRRENLGGDFEVMHVNYGLRGQESDGDEAFVRSLCTSNGIACNVHHVDGKSRDKTVESGGIQEWARAVRHGLFKEHVKRGALVVLAHQFDDQVETALFRMVRGISARYWLGMEESTGGLWRPLLNVRRKQIEQYANQYKLPHREDASNAKIDYDRNFIRHCVLGPLAGRFPEAGEKILQLAQEANALAAWAETSVQPLLERSRVDRQLSSRDLRDCPEVLQNMAVSLYLREQAGRELELSRQSIAGILKKAHEIFGTMRRCTVSLAGDRQVEVTGSGISVTAPSRPQLKKDRAVQWARASWPVDASLGLQPGQTAAIKDFQHGSDCFRFINTGTEALDLRLFQPLGRANAKWRRLLKELCVEHRVSEERRFRWLILQVNGGLYLACNGKELFDLGSKRSVDSSKLGLRVLY